MITTATRIIGIITTIGITTTTAAAAATATTIVAGLRGLRYGGYIGPERLRVV